MPYTEGKLSCPLCGGEVEVRVAHNVERGWFVKSLLVLLFCSVCLAQDPNIPVMRTYVGEPNEPVFFDFRVIDLDGDKVNVDVSGLGRWLNPPVVDPNGMMSSYTGDVKLGVGVFHLLIVADDRKAGDTRPLDATPDGPKSAKAYIRFDTRKKINRRPLIR